MFDHHHHTLNRRLSNNPVNGTIPSSIGSLVNLEYLYAQSNTWHSQILILQSITNTNHLNQSSIDTLSLSILDHHHHIEQELLRKSTERYHSIIDWLSRETSVLVRSIQHMTLTNTHSPINHHQSSQSINHQSILSLSLSLSLDI